MEKKSIFWNTDLPEAPARIFLIGIGGIGMSSLAQLLLCRGYQVRGSDRGLADEGKQELYGQLRKMGIGIYVQDGSGMADGAPDAVICSAAIEPGNADLQALSADCPVIHRARALSCLLQRLQLPLITVAGSCGKTSVCGWLAAAVQALGHGILMVNGGYSLDFATPEQPGNFHSDPHPEFLIAEVDESDRSIREFSPDYSILLNVGNDHYEKEELENIFGAYLQRTKKAAVLPENLRMLAPPELPAGTFSEKALSGAPEVLYPVNYRCRHAGIEFEAGPGGPSVFCRQAGFHSALNGMAVFLMLKRIFPEKSEEELAAALSAYHGVKQRFEIMSREGAFPVVNDYAHNPEKIVAALQAARDRFAGRILAVFQPHGYGPWGFMREALKEELGTCLRRDDLFLVLPVYYAGGTSSFSPSSEEVAAEFAAAGLPVQAVPDRRTAEEIIVREMNAGRDRGCVLVMGARDASLRVWTGSLARLLDRE